MFLTKLTLKTTHPAVSAMLANYYLLHQWLWLAFTNCPQQSDVRMLFRVERVTDDDTQLLLQSKMPPAAEHWQCDLFHSPLETRAYRPDYRDDELLYFRIRMNPIRRLRGRPDDKRSTGKRVPLVRQTEQVQWLAGKGAPGGFSLITYHMYDQGEQISCKMGVARICHFGITCDGILQVTDRERFHQTLVSGVGPAKGLGFGLLSVARTTNSRCRDAYRCQQGERIVSAGEKTIGMTSTLSN